MKEEKEFYGWDIARFHINFPNGNYLSTVWGDGTYTDNYNTNKIYDFQLKRTTERPVFNSSTVEIMFTCPEKLKKKILKKYNDGNDDPIGYLTLEKWLEIVNLLAK